MEKANPIYAERAGQHNFHHILPKKRNGKKTPDNLIRMDVNRHAAYHLLFGNLTFLEAAALLKRAALMKGGRR